MAVDPNKLTTLTGTRQDAVNKTISGFTTETPGHADYINQVFQQLIDNVATLDGDSADAVRTLRLNQIDLALELETLKGATLTGVTANIFVESFLATTDITSLNGALKHDATNKKIYLA